MNHEDKKKKLDELHFAAKTAAKALNTYFDTLDALAETPVYNAYCKAMVAIDTLRTAIMDEGDQVSRQEAALKVVAYITKKDDGADDACTRCTHARKDHCACGVNADVNGCGPGTQFAGSPCDCDAFSTDPNANWRYTDVNK